MALEAVTKVSAATYQNTSSAAQNRTVEAAQSAAPAAQVSESLSQSAGRTAMKGGYTNEKTAEQQIEQDNEKIKKAVNDLNKKMDNTTCQYGIHEGTGRVTIKIIDKTTKEVIKEYPAEETLDMISKVWELAGIMMDEKL